MAQDSRTQLSYKTGDTSGFAKLIAGFPITRVSAGNRLVATLNWHEREQREE